MESVFEYAEKKVEECRELKRGIRDDVCARLRELLSQVEGAGGEEATSPIRTAALLRRKLLEIAGVASEAASRLTGVCEREKAYRDVAEKIEFGELEKA